VSAQIEMSKLAPQLVNNLSARPAKQGVTIFTINRHASPPGNFLFHA
jgi:hypothetical protein